MRGHDAVIHAAAIPEPTRNPPHQVFRNNLMATFNVIEAAVRFGVPRVVNVSSETVPGFFFPEREFLPDYAPVDEEHPIRPQDPYALSKHFGEQLMDAAVRRSDLTGVSIRPSWVQWEGNYDRNLGPRAARSRGLAVGELLGLHRRLRPRRRPAPRGRARARPGTRWSTSPRPTTTPTARSPSSCATTTASEIELRELDREDASGISIRKARRLLGYAPSRSWRDYLTDEGELRPAHSDRLDRGETGVQRGRALTG